MFQDNQGCVITQKNTVLIRVISLSGENTGRATNRSPTNV
jgi:hypothetical protein